MGGELPPRVAGPRDSAKRRAPATPGPGLRFLLSGRPHSRRSRERHSYVPARRYEAVSGSDGAFQRALGRSPSSLLLAGSSVAVAQVLRAATAMVGGALMAATLRKYDYPEMRVPPDSAPLSTQPLPCPILRSSPSTDPVLTTHNGVEAVSGVFHFVDERPIGDGRVDDFAF